MPISKKRRSKAALKTSRKASAPAALPDRRAMESFLAAIAGRRGDDATAKAQDVMYEAWERTSAGIAAARAEGRVGGRRKKLDAAKRREIAESVITGRKSGAEMARLYNISQPTVSRIVAQHRMASP